MIKNKFHAKKTVKDGITFDSHMEAKRYAELKLREKAGELTLIEVHPVFVIHDGGRNPWTGKKILPIHYEGDFLIQFADLDHRVCEDVKGVQTRHFRDKWKMAIMRYPDIEFRMLKTAVRR